MRCHNCDRETKALYKITRETNRFSIDLGRRSLIATKKEFMEIVCLDCIPMSVSFFIADGNKLIVEKYHI